MASSPCLDRGPETSTAGSAASFATALRSGPASQHISLAYMV